MLTKIRLRSAWIVAPLYLWLAQPEVRLLLIGAVFVLAGGLVRAWAAGTIRKNRVLTTHGPYAFTRNPLYLGSFLIGVGLVIASGQPWFTVLLVLFLILYGKVIRKEERRLERLFGDEFRAYAARVPRFVPRIPTRAELHAAPPPAGMANDDDVDDAPPAPPPGRFTLRRYIKHREYQALLGIAVVYLALVVKLALD